MRRFLGSLLVVAALATPVLAQLNPIPAVNAGNFDQLVLDASAAQPVAVLFTGGSCHPCQLMNAALDALAGDLTGQIAIVKLDVDESRSATLRYGVTSIPTILVFDKGAVAPDPLVGPVPRKKLAQWLESYVR
jgi:thioredoxin 1